MRAPATGRIAYDEPMWSGAVRRARLVAVAAVGAAVAALAGCGGAGATPSPQPTPPDKVLYATSSGQLGRDAYVYVGIDKGLFRDAGIEVTVRPGAGTESGLRMLATGNVDFTPVDFAGALIQLGSGAAHDVTAVAAIHQRTTACVLALDGHGIASARDLSGRALGAPSGSTIGALFPTYATRAGLDPKTVRLVELATDRVPTALADGTVDALGETVMDAPTVQRPDRKAVVLPFGDYLGELYGDVLLTSARLARQKPELVSRFTRALLAALQYAVDHPAEAARILRDHGSTQDAKLAAQELTLLRPYVEPSGTGTPVGGFDRQRVARDIALMEGADAVPTGLTPDRVVDFDVAPPSAGG